jgi:hypothetical protein
MMMMLMLLRNLKSNNNGKFYVPQVIISIKLISYFFKYHVLGRKIHPRPFILLGENVFLSILFLKNTLDMFTKLISYLNTIAHVFEKCHKLVQIAN